MASTPARVAMRIRCRRQVLGGPAAVAHRGFSVRLLAVFWWMARMGQAFVGEDFYGSSSLLLRY